jgi:hypothetical protein
MTMEVVRLTSAGRSRDATGSRWWIGGVWVVEGEESSGIEERASECVVMVTVIDD